MNRQLILVLKYLLKAVSEVNNNTKQAYIDEANSILLELENNHSKSLTLVDINTNTEAINLVNEINDNLDKNKLKVALQLFTKLKSYQLSNKTMLDELETKLSTKMKFLLN